MLYRNRTTEEKEYKKRACLYCGKELNIYPFSGCNVCFCDDCRGMVCYRDTDTEEEVAKKWRRYKGMGVWVNGEKLHSTDVKEEERSFSEINRAGEKKMIETVKKSKGKLKCNCCGKKLELRVIRVDAFDRDLVEGEDFSCVLSDDCVEFYCADCGAVKFDLSPF